MDKIRYFSNVFAQCDLKSDLGACPKIVFGSACLCICSSIILMSVLVKIVAFGPVSCMYCSKVGQGNSERLPFILRPLYQRWLRRYWKQGTNSTLCRTTNFLTAWGYSEQCQLSPCELYEVLLLSKG